MKETVIVMKQKIHSTVDALPPEGVSELSRYLDTLKRKYGVEGAAPVVALGAIWADIPFDITDDEVRSLRQRVTDKYVDGE